MRQLFVGDIHCKPDELGDCENLMVGVESTLLRENINECWFMGDQFNTHSLVHLDVLRFWFRWITRLSKITNIYLIVGNHDLAPSGTHAMLSFEGMDKVTIIDKPTLINGLLSIPYCTKEQFIQALNDFKSPGRKVVIGHITFHGARFENGFYSPDGLDATDIPNEYSLVISGHIHEPQELNSPNLKVVYTGSPRWLNLSDANSDRFIYAGDVDGSGVHSWQAINTDQWCKKMVRLELVPGMAHPVLSDSVEYYFDLKGPKMWCDEMAATLSPEGKVRVFPEQTKMINVKESEGIFEAFGKFLDGYIPKIVNSMDGVKTLIQERFNE